MSFRRHLPDVPALVEVRLRELGGEGDPTVHSLVQLMRPIRGEDDHA